MLEPAGKTDLRLRGSLVLLLGLFPAAVAPDAADAAAAASAADKVLFVNVGESGLKSCKISQLP